MSETRKISIRKIMQLAVTVLVTGACATAMISASQHHNSRKIEGFNINIKNDAYRFIDKEDVKMILVNNRKQDILKTSIGKLDARRIEKTVVSNPWVADAQVYVDNDKVVHINLTQRVPLARVFDKEGNSYYLDHTMKAMPLSDKYIHYTTVVTNAPVLKDDSIGNDMKGQIVALVKYIERDEFWRAQISQIIVNDDKTFEVVPVLGKQRIIIGDTSRMDEKFDNLYAFYKKVSNRIGWDKYEVLDLRYAGQVVATPALAWTPPVDKAMSSMNWVRSIIGKDSGAYKIDSPTMQVLKVQTTKTVVPVPQNVAAANDAAKKAAEAVKHEAVSSPSKDKKAAGEKKKTDPAKVQHKIEQKKIVNKKSEIKEKSPPKKKDNKIENHDKEKQAQPKYLYH